MESTEESLRQILIEVSSISPEADANADLYLDLGVASVHAMMLLMAIEDRFQIHLPDDQFIEARSISQLAGLIDSLLEQPQVHV